MSRIYSSEHGAWIDPDDPATIPGTPEFIEAHEARDRPEPPSSYAMNWDDPFTTDTGLAPWSLTWKARNVMSDFGNTPQIHVVELEIYAYLDDPLNDFEGDLSERGSIVLGHMDPETAPNVVGNLPPLVPVLPAMHVFFNNPDQTFEPTPAAIRLKNNAGNMDVHFHWPPGQITPPSDTDDKWLVTSQMAWVWSTA